MIAYSYDLEGHYTGAVACQKHPRKQGEWLKPANTTFIAPPESDSYTADKIPLFNEDSEEWELVDSPEKLSNDNVLLETVNSQNVNLYERDQNGKVVLREESEVEAETLERDNITLAIQAKKQCEYNIALKAIQMSGTTNMESAKAEIQGWQLRKEVPEEYSDDGLVVTFEIENYPLGTELDSPLAINEYYTKLCIIMDKYRLSEIKIYEDYLETLNLNASEII